MELRGRVLVYSILGCPHCMKAKSTLQDRGVPYTDVNLEMYPQARQELQARSQKRTVPQIFFNARHIGGNDDLQKLVLPCDKSWPRTNACLSWHSLTHYFISNVICQKVPYRGKNIVGPDLMHSVWSGPTILIAHEHLQQTFLSFPVQF